jgi:hypothetical protein
MLPTARAFLKRLIDYAGMFPPARLPMRDAYRRYAELASGPEAWMLGRFVCPAAQLGDLLAIARADSAPPILDVAALGRGGVDAAACITHLDLDVRDVTSFRDGIGAGGRVDVIEMPLPSPLPREAIADLVDRIASQINAAGLRVFLEIPYGPGWLEHVAALSEALLRHNKEEARFGLKIRCGGALPTSVPSIADLAWFVAWCRDSRLPWKATAGLHHALYHESGEATPPAHGFVNVFAAGILAHTHALDAAILAEILREREFSAFRFTPDRIAWRAWECRLEDIRMARGMSQSFGSCSFDEPRDDLVALGLTRS